MPTDAWGWIGFGVVIGVPLLALAALIARTIDERRHQRAVRSFSDAEYDYSTDDGVGECPINPAIYDEHVRGIDSTDFDPDERKPTDAE